MFWVGCHLSASKGYLAMGKMAEKIGANTFQFFLSLIHILGQFRCLR